MKEKLFVSFSGGKTSAYMSYMLKKDYGHKYDMRFVFANTGLEHEETLEFVDKCDKAFGLNVVWIEAVVDPRHMKGIKHRVTDFKNAYRPHQYKDPKHPFHAHIAKSGIPNPTYKQCSDRLKALPIEHYKKTIGWKGCKHTIGMRADEPNRVFSAENRKVIASLGMSPKKWRLSTNKKRISSLDACLNSALSWPDDEYHNDLIKKIELLKGFNKYNLVYPLSDWFETDKLDVNIFWEMQSFRLELEGHRGNCKTCWKKSDKKLWLISLESPSDFTQFRWWEKTYQHVKPNTNGQARVFFRKNRSVDDLFKESELMDEYTLRRMIGYKEDDDSGCSESCEAYAE